MPALWKLTLLPHVIGRVRLGGGIKGLPTGPLPSGAALANIDRRLIQDRFEPRPLCLGYACRDQRPAAATKQVRPDLALLKRRQVNAVDASRQ